MTRESTVRLRIVTSDDGTRCAAECPQTTERRHWCDLYGAIHGAIRPPACITAEQAAASVLSCDALAGVAVVHFFDLAMMDEMRSRYDLTVRDLCVGMRSSEKARVAAQEIERRMRDSERAYPPTCPECGVAECAPDTGIYECGGTYETALASAPHLDGGARALDASEALREARVQGMREGFRIVELRADQPGEHGYESDPGVAWEDASLDLDAAIEAVRKGER